MKLFILSFMLCVACTYAAPLLPEAAKQYLILTPQPAIHIQPQLIQPISHLSRLQAPNHVLLYYPSTPLAPFQLNDRRIEFTNLKQSEELVPDNNPWDNFLMQIQGFFQQFNPDNSTNVINQQIGSRVGDMSSKFMIPMMPADAEQLPAMAGETPASTVRLDKRFYIISGQPQFYGNFDALKNPLNPIFSLQSLQPIKARSSSTIDAIPPQIVEHQVQPQLVPIQAFSPIEPLPLQLKANPEVYGELLGGQQQGRELLDDEEEKKEDSKQGRSQSDMPAAENALAEEEMKAPEMLKDAEMLKAAEMMNDASPMMAGEDEEAGLSIAIAKPSALALAGKGGIASTKPVATAVSDDYGLASAAPHATSIAGDYLAEDDEAKKE